MGTQLEVSFALPKSNQTLGENMREARRRAAGVSLQPDYDASVLSEDITVTR